jgi:hypothetical protein
MNTKISGLLLMALCMGFTAFSQTLSNTVVAASGSYSTASWGSLSATVGEASISTLTATGTILTEGFQQPEANLTGITSLKKSLVSASVYPNPAAGNFYLEVTLPSSANITYKIYDMAGKEVRNGGFAADALHTTITKIDASTLSSGMYMIALQNGESALQNFKIQINH